MKIFKFLTVFCLLFILSGSAFAAGACPASAPVVGNNCYFIAASGSDTNNGTSEATPWAHAPGMPNCASNCAAGLPSFGGSLAGIGYIFRGGDSWHFGNSGATPYTGGTWKFEWNGNATNRMYEGNLTGCVYMGGGDITWFNSAVCGASWCRPKLNADNSLSTSLVGSCTYQVGGTQNTFVDLGDNIQAIYFDGFEMLGLCGSTTSSSQGHSNTYLVGGNTGISGQGMEFWNNLYIHGWTGTNNANSNLVCNILGGGNEGLESITQMVIDGSDSNAAICTWGQFPSFYHFKDSIVRYTTDGVGQQCHDIHDNIFEHIVPVIPSGHTNVLECNDDSNGNAPGQPQNTPNVVYNNIVRHSNSNVMLWFCPNASPAEYWFNNLIYDSTGEGWSIAGPPAYSCSNSGGQFMFNNTLVDGNSGGWYQPCYLPTLNIGGQYLTIYNEHLINTPYDSGTTACTGHAGPTIINMTDAVATSQGYTTGAAGTYVSNNCANEITTPCAPTLNTNGTVGTGGNHQAYCTTLASFAATEYAIGTEAANACKYGTTDGCAYLTANNSMSCPAQTPVIRPTSAAWDSGAYELGSTMPPNPPTGLTITVH